MPELRNVFYIFKRRDTLMRTIFSEELTSTADELNQQWAKYFNVEIRARKLGNIRSGNCKLQCCYC